MSFILDALKKSETDRQRQGGPALFEVKVAPPRRALPAWAAAVAVLFVANLAVVGWLMLRHTAPAAESAPPASALRPEPGAVVPAAAAPAAVALSAPAAAAPAVSPAPRAVVTAPAEAPATERATEPPPSADDYAPAAEPPLNGGIGKVKRGSDAGVPFYAQLAAAPGSQLPQLRLDLHAYAERPEDRWVLLNMHKLREGDSLEGVRVEHITPEGAVLSYRGSQFLLTRE